MPNVPDGSEVVTMPSTALRLIDKVAVIVVLATDVAVTVAVEAVTMSLGAA